jgi:hypothetical protein
MLPHITKILIIGWQAKEAHFLEMLRLKLPLLNGVMVVGGSASDAEGTLKYFLSEIRYIPPHHYVGEGGFTDFIVNQEGHGFFKT